MSVLSSLRNKPSRLRRRAAPDGRRRLTPRRPPAAGAGARGRPAPPPSTPPRCVARVERHRRSPKPTSPSRPTTRRCSCRNIPDEQKRELLIGYLVDLKLGARAAEAAKIGDDRRLRPQARL